jgi:AcrR family transcriptional regulator
MSHSQDLEANRKPTASTAAPTPTVTGTETAPCSDPRERILDALIATVAYRGYDRTTVERVLQTADVPGAVFDEHFHDKEDCFLQALDAMVARLRSSVLEQYDRRAPWPDRVRRGLKALLAALASDPEAARVGMVECLSAGPAANERYRQTLLAFVPLLEEGRRHAAYPEHLPPQTSEAVVGGIASILHRRVLEERTPELPQLLGDLVYFALVPYMGHHRAITAAGIESPPRVASGSQDVSR